MVNHQDELEPQMLPFAVPKSVAESRISICKSCERFTKLKLCNCCMCYMPYKTKLSFSTCPKGKWE